jgi:hypothetical protein
MVTTECRGQELALLFLVCQVPDSELSLELLHFDSDYPKFFVLVSSKCKDTASISSIKPLSRPYSPLPVQHSELMLPSDAT